MTRVLFAVLAALTLFHQGSTTLDAQGPTPPLGFFKNYFLTGDYAVQGVGLRGAGVSGFATDDIVVPECAPGDPERLGCVPRGVDVVAAFLYWQVVEDVTTAQAGARGVQFRGQPLSLTSGGVDVLYGKALGASTAPCWPGGSGSTPMTVTYRADVLRLLTQDPQTGRTAGYGAHQVRLRDDAEVTSLGASLVLVYRDSALPYSAIVLYDGNYSMAQSARGMVLDVGGFYESDDSNTAGKITHVVGSRQGSHQEVLFYNDTRWADPFTGTAGRDWDNLTFPVAITPARRTVTTGAVPVTVGSADCLTWSAVVYRTPVNDDDGDGLLNLWETSQTPVVDPYGRALPPLARMGADPNVKDIFIEVNYLTTGTAAYAYGGLTEPAHSHLPDPDAIRLFGDMFKAKGINVHVDLGPAYDVGAVTGAEPYVIRDTVPGLARGGESLDEALTVCTAPAGSPPWACQFSAYPGTVGWKTGLRRLRDSLTSAPNPGDPMQADCDAPGNTCERRFDEVRHDIFRYALFGHFIGLPKSTRPCLDAALNPIEDVGGECPAGATPNADFRVPRTYSGVADFPGGDLMVTLGGFRNTAGLPVGTPFMQATTLAHEFGHTAERRHGGEAAEPNCKPGYLSVMNYLYQLRGLLDDAGTPHLDFSDGTPFVDVDESFVLEGVTSASPYRLGWYAPLDFSYLKNRRPPVKSRCDGSVLEPGERMVRIDARASADPIDWNANDVIDGAAFPQDVNFNGRVNGTTSGGSGPLLGTSDDWSNLKLDQVGSRRNVGGLYRLSDGTLAVGPLSLDVGKVDLGPSDLGKVDLDLGKVDLDFGKVDLDLGKVDLSLGKVDLDAGKVDLGKVDLDLGAAETGSGDIGRGDFGGGDLFTDDPENPVGELDATLAADLGRTAPNAFRACVAGPGCTAVGATTHDVVTRFTAPNIGGVTTYALYRVDGPSLIPGAAWTLVTTIAADPQKPQDEEYVAIDTTELVDAQTYTYFTVATYASDGLQGAVQSDPSNLVSIAAINSPLVAGADAYVTSEDTPLIVAAPGVLGNDGDQDSPVSLAATLVSGPTNGTLTLNPDGSFAYTPVSNFSGTDAFTYRPVQALPATATVSLAITAVDDGPSISPVGNQTIGAGTRLGPLPIGISDTDNVDDVTLTAIVTSTTNPNLFVSRSITFGGTGAARTLSVTPAAGQSGIATIRLTPVGAGGVQGTPIAFVLTVTPPSTQGIYTFRNVKNAPPPPSAALKAGTSISTQWRYLTVSGAPVNSSAATFQISVSGAGGALTLSSSGASGSAFRYQSSSSVWAVTLPTRLPTGTALAPGLYTVTIEVTNDQGEYQTATYPITLVK